MNNAQARTLRKPAARPEAAPAESPRDASRELADELSDLLAGLAGEHEKLLGLAEEQRSAARRADPARLEQATRVQAECLRRVADLEERRRRVVQRASQSEPTRGAVTLSEIAGRLSEPDRSRLVAQASRVRELIARARDEQRALGVVMRSLSQHMEGLMRQVARRMNPAGTYGRRGVVDAGAPGVAALRAVDMNS